MIQCLNNMFIRSMAMTCFVSGSIVTLHQASAQEPIVSIQKRVEQVVSASCASEAKESYKRLFSDGAFKSQMQHDGWLGLSETSLGGSYGGVFRKNPRRTESQRWPISLPPRNESVYASCTPKAKGRWKSPARWVATVVPSVVNCAVTGSARVTPLSSPSA